jgi:predicted ATPase
MNADGAELIHFGPYCLDRLNARLSREGRSIPLTPKALDLLTHLASRPDRLVTKDELLSAVWPDVIVSDASIKVCIGELRKALGDDPRSPNYIETVHRRGYRFLARAASTTTPALAARESPVPAAPGIVGRDAELSTLKAVLERARVGERQVVFITGDAGSGKTTLVDALCRFASHVDGAAWHVAIGHCFEQFGAGEPYMPVWEAIAQLDRARAPTPLPVPARALPRPTPPAAPTEPRATPDRVLRELVESLEARATRTPLLLILEDLHWSDYSTLDLLSALARRTNEARLVVVGTYRPGDAGAAGHPLRGVAQELIARRLSCEIALGPLEESHVSEYLRRRMPPDRVSDDLVHGVYLRTHGHPLFLASLVEDLVERGPDVVDERAGAAGSSSSSSSSSGGGVAHDVAAALPVPDNVRVMIQTQLERLTERDQRVLEAAAVAGVNPSAAAVAAATGEDLVRCEQLCADLAARHRFLEPDGVAEWPDGTIASRYRFVHELYHNVVYARIPAARCVILHRALAARVRRAWAARHDEIAPELAMHSERGREWLPAVEYLRRCAARATDHYAHREAVDYLRRARAAVERLPDEDRRRHELDILMSLAVHLQVTDGFAAPSVREVHDRAYALCRDVPDTRAVFPVLWGIWLYKKVRSDLVEARELAGQLLSMAERTRDTALLTQAHQAMSVTSLCRGEPLETCRQLRRMQLIYDPVAHAVNTQHYGQDPGVACLSFGAVTLWITGEVEEAMRIGQESLDLARSIRQPSSLALALHFSAMLHQCLGDPAATERHAREAAALAEWEGFSFWRAGAAILRGWATAAQGNCADGIPMIRQGTRDWLATGSRTYHTYYLGLLTDALLRCGDTGEALTTVDDAIRLVGELHEGLYAAELHRLRAQCLLRSDRADAEALARSALRQSISIARQQCATSFEERSAADLSLLGDAEPAPPSPPRRPRPPTTSRAARDRHARPATVPSSRRRP